MVGVGRHAVYQQAYVGLLALAFGLELHQVVLYAHYLAVHFHAGKALLHVYVELLHEGASFAGHDGCQHHELGALREGEHALHYVFGGMFLHQLSAHGRVGLAHAGEEQTQVFVNLGRCSHGGAWVAARYFLLDGDGGRDALDEVALGLAHAAQELAGVAAEAFHVAALAFGVEGIECQGGLARTRQTGDYH